MRLSLLQKRIWAICYFLFGILHIVCMLTQFSEFCDIPLGPYSALYSILVLGSDRMTSSGIVTLLSGLGLLIHDLFILTLFLIAYWKILKKGSVWPFLILCFADAVGAALIFLLLADSVLPQKWIGVALSFVHVLIFFLINRQELLQTANRTRCQGGRCQGDCSLDNYTEA